MSSHRHQDQEWTGYQWSDPAVAEDPDAVPRTVESGLDGFASLSIEDRTYLSPEDGYSYDSQVIHAKDEGYASGMHFRPEPGQVSAPAPAPAPASKGKDKERSDSRGKQKASKSKSKHKDYRDHRDREKKKDKAVVTQAWEPFYETEPGAASRADNGPVYKPPVNARAADASRSSRVLDGHDLAPENVPAGNQPQPVDPRFGYAYENEVHVGEAADSQPFWRAGDDEIEPHASYVVQDFLSQEKYDQTQHAHQRQERAYERHEGKKTESKARRQPDKAGLGQKPVSFVAKEAPAVTDDDDDDEFQQVLQRSRMQAYPAEAPLMRESSSQHAPVEEAYVQYSTQQYDDGAYPQEQHYEAAYPQDLPQPYYDVAYPPERSGERTPRGPASPEVPEMLEMAEEPDYGKFDIQGNPTTGASERLDARYVVEHSMKFQPGAVFKVLWSEPLGQGSDSQMRQHDNVTEVHERTHMGQRFYVGFRRFIVIANDEGHCTCVPILTYEHRACTKKGVKPQKHGIVHGVGTQPRLHDHEPKLGFRPVRVQLNWPSEKLAWQSRINYSKLVTIEHNVKVFFIGRIVSEDFDIVREAVDRCWDSKLRKQGRNHHR